MWTSGPWLKVFRAAEHLQALVGDIGTLQATTHPIIEERDPETGERIFRLGQGRYWAGPRPLYFPVMAGDVVHQLRSALDHSVWMLAEPPIKGRTAFPVCIDESGKRNSFYGTSKQEGTGIKALVNVSTDVFELIERLQPFNKLHERDPLWILHELWNQDKHRSLIVVAEPRKDLREVIRAPGGRDSTRMRSGPVTRMIPVKFCDSPPIATLRWNSSQTCLLT